MEVSLPNSEDIWQRTFLEPEGYIWFWSIQKFEIFLSDNFFTAITPLHPKKNSYDNTFLFTIMRHPTIVFNADISLKTCSKPPSQPAKTVLLMMRINKYQPTFQFQI